MRDYSSFGLSKARIDKAKTCLKAAYLNIENDLFADSANRSYYCIFHSMRAVLALENVDFKKHSSVIAYFNQHYLKTEKLPKAFSKIISKAFDIRNDSDYEDFYIVSKEEVEEQANNAKMFLEAVEEYIDSV
ncbi:MAG: HEPN domain-containing protein [Oscillospiraceae bacterium]|nr:HEPN domain-containing protein [Oscillospiraceae bacterium]